MIILDTVNKAQFVLKQPTSFSCLSLHRITKCYAQALVLSLRIVTACTMCYVWARMHHTALAL